MEPGLPLLTVSLASSFSAFALFVAKKEELGEIFLYVSTSSAFAGLLLLINYFVTDTFSIWYVYANSNAEMPLLYKISAAWAGKEGSLLLWVVFNLLVTSFYINWGKKDEKKAKVAAIMTLFTSYLTANILLFSNPFVALPYAPPNGAGLNPLLRTTEMVFHPPVVFLAYSLSALLFSVTLAKSYGEKTVARLAWFFLTLGIVIGGWWAYRTLEWGGFWGWDPVENASLLPWLTLTAYFHLTRGREYFAYLTFSLVLFATLVTRSGIISSVHSFGGEASDYSYVIPILVSLTPLISKVRQLSLSSLCNQNLPVIFLSAAVVVFLGTVAGVSVTVEREYYLITFLPVFALIAFLVALKIRKISMPTTLLHLGVILLFIGATSVWLFEDVKTIKITQNSTGDFSLLDLRISEDAEKYILTAFIQTPDGLISPEVYAYKVAGNQRVSSVDIIPELFWDNYYSIKDLDLENGTITLEYYRVPLINAVWIGSAFMVLGVLFRFSGKSF
ncbi:MAG: heme lyase CcmF/NrfE family subunit [Archaeoglobus sp.]|uniref:cytochrome c biogenesis protein CcsA n=1 Tax=Archaeoglobus sp. TaxID=1872626 RepID=UPI001D61BAE5|nr:cytochrome c biogenesis protein CcsA [Archaeoglobus sp.]MBO8179221.1 heme lyase CcmF/NrfE family subunit [Archaeoglobus sp.]